MAYSVELKDQQLLVILSLDDALEAVGEYAGEELKRYLASYYEVNLADVDDYEKSLTRWCRTQKCAANSIEIYFWIYWRRQRQCPRSYMRNT